MNLTRFINTPQDRLFVRLVTEYVRAERDVFILTERILQMIDDDQDYEDEKAERDAQRLAGTIMHSAIIRWVKEQPRLTFDQRRDIYEALKELRAAQNELNLSLCATWPLDEEILAQNVQAAARKLCQVAQA